MLRKFSMHQREILVFFQNMAFTFDHVISLCSDQHSTFISARMIVDKRISIFLMTLFVGCCRHFFLALLDIKPVKHLYYSLSAT